MPDFITTDNGEWSFSLDDTPVIPDLPANDPLIEQGPKRIGYLEGPGKWENYSDPVLYEVEVLLRKWIEKKISEPEWNERGMRGIINRKYQASMVYESLYGKPYDRKDKDCLVRVRRLTKLLAYYSGKIQKGGSIHGKKTTKTIYHFSLSRCKKKPPYCLKLRLEWLSDRGELPCWQNMKLPKDDLKAGQARNPRTNENMRIRSERAKQRYNERYGDRAH